MHHIYARTYLTPSALGAENGDDGLFLPRDLAAVEDEALLWDKELVNPLKNRGWAFQEQQLSSRLIHFGKKRLIWECCSTITYEDRPTFVHR